MEELKELVEKYSNDEIRIMEKLHESSEALLDLVKSAERRINILKESQEEWIIGFDYRNKRMDHNIEISMMAKNRLIRSYQAILKEMLHHSKAL